MRGEEVTAVAAVQLRIELCVLIPGMSPLRLTDPVRNQWARIVSRLDATITAY